jgi:hypothetical protein
MRIIDGLEQKGREVNIPDCGRLDLPRFFLDMGYKVGAEIGVCKAWFTQKFCRAGLSMYAVDAWLAYEDYNEPERNYQSEQDYYYKRARKELAPYTSTGQCTIIRKFSMDAVKDFADDSLDFVYIDAHHGFKYITEDIYEWSKKVRKGGVISGHDFVNTNTIHVKLAVRAYTRAYKIRDWYVLGRDQEGEKRDMYRSWFWIKD